MVNISVNILLILKYGIAGAAIATLATQSLGHGHFLFLEAFKAKHFDYDQAYESDLFNFRGVGR